jgi:hypothetical protein
VPFICMLSTYNCHLFYRLYFTVAVYNLIELNEKTPDTLVVRISTILYEIQ